MWIELAALSAGALSYGIRRRLAITAQPNHNSLAKRYTQLRQLWQDVRDAIQTGGRDQLHGAINLEARQQLLVEKENVKRQQQLGLCALGSDPYITHLRTGCTGWPLAWIRPVWHATLGVLAQSRAAPQK